MPQSRGSEIYRVSRLNTSWFVDIRDMAGASARSCPRRIEAAATKNPLRTSAGGREQGELNWMIWLTSGLRGAGGSWMCSGLPVLDAPCGIFRGGINVGSFQVWIHAEDVVAGFAGRQQPDDRSDRNPKATDAGFAAHGKRVNRNALLQL